MESQFHLAHFERERRRRVRDDDDVVNDVREQLARFRFQQLDLGPKQLDGHDNDCPVNANEDKNLDQIHNAAETVTGAKQLDDGQDDNDQPVSANEDAILDQIQNAAETMTGAEQLDGHDNDGPVNANEDEILDQIQDAAETVTEAEDLERHDKDGPVNTNEEKGILDLEQSVKSVIDSGAELSGDDTATGSVEKSPAAIEDVAGVPPVPAQELPNEEQVDELATTDSSSKVQVNSAIESFIVIALDGKDWQVPLHDTRSWTDFRTCLSNSGVLSAHGLNPNNFAACVRSELFLFGQSWDDWMRRESTYLPYLVISLHPTCESCCSKLKEDDKQFCNGCQAPILDIEQEEVSLNANPVISQFDKDVNGVQLTTSCPQSPLSQSDLPQLHNDPNRNSLAKSDEGADFPSTFLPPPPLPSQDEDITSTSTAQSSAVNYRPVVLRHRTKAPSKDFSLPQPQSDEEDNKKAVSPRKKLDILSLAKLIAKKSASAILSSAKVVARKSAKCIRAGYILTLLNVPSNFQAQFLQSTSQSGPSKSLEEFYQDKYTSFHLAFASGLLSASLAFLALPLVQNNLIAQNLVVVSLVHSFFAVVYLGTLSLYLPVGSSTKLSDDQVCQPQLWDTWVMLSLPRIWIAWASLYIGLAVLVILVTLIWQGITNQTSGPTLLSSPNSAPVNATVNTIAESIAVLAAAAFVWSLLYLGMLLLRLRGMRRAASRLKKPQSGTTICA